MVRKRSMRELDDSEILVGWDLFYILLLRYQPVLASGSSCASVSLLIGNNKNHAQLVVQYTSTVARSMHTSKGCKLIKGI